MTLRRILVGIDASPFSRMALRSAVALAERVDAALDAVFVEDINIVRLAAHPMAQGFSLTPPHSHDMDEALVAAMLELQSAAARKAFDEAQGPARSFIVRRGRVEAELLDAAQGADLICLGWSGRAAAGRWPCPWW